METGEEKSPPKTVRRGRAHKAAVEMAPQPDDAENLTPPKTGKKRGRPPKQVGNGGLILSTVKVFILAT